ncbi:LON peptidase N-terminal domain and RING finger protein 3 [Solea senegalensis]|uniref:LON peptidase N-terminal domain and RING finger protein 3 n=1 Tax=Solea senegalensis TaxID=28829 RepID=A0AAV6SQI4_SOLSE|nr:LON peptidase N-terminal domain and RING finger protein 3-like [Solea senegalensis]KAG7518607.1 LON peptidase N-terminal domain and RING finger protein 3 [Solea senegalensis]
MRTERGSMLQLAAEAFRSKNFDLAADIYECQLVGVGDPGNRQELMVKWADALALGGKFPEAFAVYRQASEIESLTPGQLENLIEFLSGSIRRQDAGESRSCSPGRGGEEAAAATAVVRPAVGATGCGRPDFSCPICLSFLFEPVTLPCGHCFCKKCLEREKKGKICKQCGDSSVPAGLHSEYRVNVILSGLLTKCFPNLQQAGRLRREGNGLYAERKMEAALEKYNQAIMMAPMDHILFSNRSQIHSSLKHYEKALKDAEMACRLKPLWSKGHIRKAQALVSLGRAEEALREYLVCLSMEPDCRLAKTESYKLLSHLLAPVMDQVPEHILDFSNILSSRAHIKNNIPSSAPFQTLNPNILPSESRRTSSPPAQEMSDCSKDKGLGKPDTWRSIHSFMLKRKRRNSEEDEKVDGQRRGRGDEHKRFRSESTAETDSLGSEIASVLDPTDLECSLCMRLFYEPVTTPCGHTFCLRCLERCLDHNPKCPLCKEQLSEYLVQRQYSKTLLVENLISKYLPSELMERQKVHQEEMAEFSNLNKNVPIFVCTMAFPTVPCPLHIFEPCYRLMIRRCMETGTNCFGMCLADNLKGFADYGCLLEICDVKFFSDGRSVVDTIGRRRFKIIKHKERDGYNTADIEYLEDTKVEGEEERELQSLHDSVYDQALVWVNSLRAEQKARIEGHFGPMPEKDSELQACPNGPSWCWWLLAVLPLEGRAQLPFLALTSLKDRLSGMRKVLLFITQSRHR